MSHATKDGRALEGASSSKGPIEHFIAAGDVRLRAVSEAARSARRPWVVVLHGFTGSCESMEGVSRELGGDWNVLRIDLVGHGKSEVPRELEPYRMPRCVAQVLAVMDALEIPCPHLLGYSMGGRAALSLAADHPDRLSSLLLVGASAGLADPEERAARRDADERLARRILEEGLEAFVDHWMSLPLFATQKRLGEEGLAAARRQRVSSSPLGLAMSLRGMGSGAQPALQARLPELSLPVCFAVGEEDAKFQAIARDLAARLPNARLEVIPEAGHAAHLENPASFGVLARGFFENSERSRVRS